MASVRALVLRAAGTNCDLETAAAFELAGAVPERVHLHRLRERPSLLLQFQVVAIPGGFSYGDDLGAGCILGGELRHFLGDALRGLLDRGGLVIGICNGFQALVRAGLLPGGDTSTLTLASNASGRFEARWVHLRVTSDRCVWLEPGWRLDLPIAHGEGRLKVEPRGALEALRASGQAALVYTGPDGEPPGGYPDDPNGSDGYVAGLCDATGRVLGLMPHPERHVRFHHHPQWTRRGSRPGDVGDGLRVFQRGIQALA